MKSVSIHRAKKHLARLIEEASQGQPFVITKGGQPIAKVSAIERCRRLRRLGFLAGQISVPDDFNRMGSDEIEQLFGIVKR